MRQIVIKFSATTVLIRSIEWYHCRPLLILLENMYFYTIFSDTNDIPILDNIKIHLFLL